MYFFFFLSTILWVFLQEKSLKFSIVIPSFNQGKFLEEAILSILNQKFKEVEIIVIDAGSTDNTSEIIKKYEKEIFYWISEPDSGQSDALNKGFKKASGDILGWLNSDDLYLKDCFKNVEKAFIENPEKKIIYGNWIEIDEYGNLISIVESDTLPRIPHFAWEGFDVNLQAMFWKKEVFDFVGFFDLNLHRIMDSDFLFRIIFDKNLGIPSFFKINAELGAFRRHLNQKTALTKIDDRLKNEEKVVSEKFNFPSPFSLEGAFFRVKYFFHKMAKIFFSKNKKFMFLKVIRGIKKRFS